MLECDEERLREQQAMCIPCFSSLLLRLNFTHPHTHGYIGLDPLVLRLVHHLLPVCIQYGNIFGFL